jgi:hypothetical protein
MSDRQMDKDIDRFRDIGGRNTNEQKYRVKDMVGLCSASPFNTH